MSRGAVILGEKPKLPPARSIIIAPRLPAFPRETYKTPFDADGDVVVDCENVDPITGKKCGWHAVGPRREIGLAVRDHHRLFHHDETGVVRLNQPRA